MSAHARMVFGGTRRWWRFPDFRIRTVGGASPAPRYCLLTPRRPGVYSKKGPEMAQKVQVITYSDLSGKEGASAVTFGFSGSTYEIDLTGKEQDELAATLQPYVASGRRLSGRGVTKAPAAAARRGKAAAEARPNPRDVRAWAAKKGIKVSDRGRVPASVMDRYLAERG